MSRPKKTALNSAPGAPAATARPSAKAAAMQTSIVPPFADPRAATIDPQWQKTHDALQLALEQTNAKLDHTPAGDYRNSLDDAANTLSDELTALNREDIQNRTLSLAAASAQLGDGIGQLKTLRDDLDRISKTISEAAEVVTAIDGALSGLSSLLKTFPA